MESRIIFVDEKLKQAFAELSDRNKRLHKEIEKALNKIKFNIFCGRNIKKNLIPKILKQKYDVDNLWVYNLSKDWRLLYSVADNEIEVLAVVLDWMDHKDYDRLFGF
ncbi:MAG: type II toxin-antitoxin system YoeB family toxin [Nanoarchaeota archaeon]|nr:type II toxin-antitoxin system YoeB family toxin [Nanoarchaeota archaeon]